MLHGPFVGGERIIAADPQCAYLYSKNVLGAVFPKGEKAIAQDAKLALDYAINVLKGPFKLAEPILFSEPYFSEYIQCCKQ